MKLVFKNIRIATIINNIENWSFICWECEHVFTAGLSTIIDSKLSNGGLITTSPDAPPRNPVPSKPATKTFDALNQLIREDLAKTGATADEVAKAAEAEGLVQDVQLGGETGVL